MLLQPHATATTHSHRLTPAARSYFFRNLSLATAPIHTSLSSISTTNSLTNFTYLAQRTPPAHPLSGSRDSISEPRTPGPPDITRVPHLLILTNTRSRPDRFSGLFLLHSALRSLSLTCRTPASLQHIFISAAISSVLVGSTCPHSCYISTCHIADSRAATRLATFSPH